MKRVAILTIDHLALFELGCAVELFALPRPEIENWYETEVITFENMPLQTIANIQISAKKINNLNDYDMLVISSWPSESNNIDGILASEIIKFFNDGKRIISFCSGAFLLAYLGILNGRKASTHWRYADSFQQKFPQIDYLEDVLYVYDGQLGCSAGSAAALDLGIAVIKDDFGYDIANQVARRLVIATHRIGGQSQFVQTPVHKNPDLFANTLDWACQHLNESININQLAEYAHMTRRTFDRKFRSTLNMTPKHWLTQQRIYLTKQLLEESKESIEQIATKSGFENATTLRHHFRKLLGVSPNQYRQQFHMSK